MKTNGRFGFSMKFFAGFVQCAALLFLCLATARAGYLYALNDDPAGSRVYGFEVNETTGALTALPGFPVSTGALGGNALVSERMTVDRLNNRLYVINDGSNSVSAYSINPATGALAELPFSPIGLDNATWNSIDVHPSGSPLVVGDGSTSAGRIASFQITAQTATAAAGSPYPINPASAFSSVFSRDGSYVYIGGNSGAVFAGFSVNSATGVLTALPGSPFSSTTNNPIAYAFDSTGRLFTVTTTPQLHVFTFSAGIPSPVSGNPFTPGGMTQRRYGLVHPNDKYYLVAGNSNNTVGVFHIGGTGSSTTVAPVAGSPFAAGGTTANSLALNQAGTFLYVGNRLSRNITSFAFNASTGALTGQTVQPSNTLGTAGFITTVVYAALPQITASVSGRVVGQDGQGIPKATVTLTDSNGAARSAITGAFGFYTFESVAVGETYTVNALSKRHAFVPQNVFVGGQTEVILTAQP